MLSLPPAFFAASTRRAHLSSSSHARPSRDSICRLESSRVRPSEQSRKRSPGSASSAKMSGVTWLCVPRARVMTLRSGDAKPPVGHAAQPHLLFHQRVVKGELL